MEESGELETARSMEVAPVPSPCICVSSADLSDSSCGGSIVKF